MYNNYNYGTMHAQQGPNMQNTSVSNGASNSQSDEKEKDNDIVMAAVPAQQTANNNINQSVVQGSSKAVNDTYLSKNSLLSPIFTSPDFVGMDETSDEAWIMRNYEDNLLFTKHFTSQMSDSTKCLYFDESNKFIAALLAKNCLNKKAELTKFSMIIFATECGIDLIGASIILDSVKYELGPAIRAASDMVQMTKCYKDYYLNNMPRALTASLKEQYVCHRKMVQDAIGSNQAIQAITEKNDSNSRIALTRLYCQEKSRQFIIDFYLAARQDTKELDRMMQAISMILSIVTSNIITHVDNNGHTYYFYKSKDICLQNTKDWMQLFAAAGSQRLTNIFLELSTKHVGCNANQTTHQNIFDQLNG